MLFTTKLHEESEVDLTIFLFLRDLRVLRGIPFLLIRKNDSIIRIAVILYGHLCALCVLCGKFAFFYQILKIDGYCL